MDNREIKNYGLIINDPLPEHWEVGSGKATQRLGVEAGEINSEGKWLKYIKEDELQKRFDFDTQACTNFGTHKALISLATHKNYLYFPRNCSERYTGVCTGNTESGNDPWQVIEKLAKKYGVVAEKLLPWSDDIRGWDDYYSPKPMAEEFIKEGERVLRKYNINWEWVFNSQSNLTPKEKRERLQQALKRGTVCVSVRAWEKEGLVYTKQKGAADGHWVFLGEYKGDTPVIHDQYPPFVKNLDKDYDFNVAILYFMTPNESGVLPKDKPTFLVILLRILQLIKQKLGLWKPD